MRTYNFKTFDYVDDYVYIPEDVVFYRGVPKNSTEVLRKDIPIYLAPEYIAKMYGNQLVQLHPKNLPLKLMDVRKMTGLLQYLLSTIKEPTQEAQDCVAFLSLAYGLVSYEKQISLLNFMYVNTYPSIKQDLKEKISRRLNRMKTFDWTSFPHNPLEKSGVRTSDTYINGIAVMILQELFSDLCDGYIAPRIFSPYPDELFVHEEIVVFHPQNVMKVISNQEVVIEEIQRMTTSPKIEVKYKNVISVHIIVGGKVESYEDPNSFFDNKKDVKHARKIAKKFASKFTICQPSMSELNNMYVDMDPSKFPRIDWTSCP